MLKGIDTSFAQGDIRWDLVHDESMVAFVYHRASYGSDPGNDDGDTFAKAHDACKYYKIPFGTYHFWTAWDEPISQAKNFLAAANGRYGDLLVMVDVEEDSFKHGDPGSVTARIDALSKTLATIGSAVGQPIIYTNADTWNSYFGGTDAFSGHKLWVANYPATPGKPSMPAGFKEWTLHQYADDGIVPGIKTHVDLDVLNGNDISLIKRV